MKKYRKLPVVIEASQWFKMGDHEEVYEAKYMADNKCSKCHESYNKHGRVGTLEGEHLVCVGDWIIRGVKKEYYPCKPDIFEMTYEEVADGDSGDCGLYHADADGKSECEASGR